MRNAVYRIVSELKFVSGNSAATQQDKSAAAQLRNAMRPLGGIRAVVGLRAQRPLASASAR